MARRLVIAILGLLSLAPLAFGLNLIVHSFVGYRDSPWWIYTVWGLFCIGLALLLGGLACLAAQRSRRHLLH